MSRLQGVVDSLTGLEEPDDLFLEIMEALTEKEIIPEPGKYYTFIYQAKTPQILIIPIIYAQLIDNLM